MHAFVGAHRDRAPDARQRLVLTGRQRLLDQRDAGIGAGREVEFEVVGRPGLVGIHDQFGFGRGLADRRDSRVIAVAAELDLQQRAARGLGGCRRHRLGCAERNREGRGAGTWCGTAEQAPGPAAGTFRLEIQQRAVQRIAGGAGRHRGLQGDAVQTPRDRFPHRLERGQRRFRRLAIARIGHAFAVSGVVALADGGNDGNRLGFRAAADGEGACDRPALDADDKLSRCAGSHFKIWQIF
jgi:hypothetical protein